MSELQLKSGDALLFKAIVGSQSYGTSTPTSDIDYKGVYMQDRNDILGFKYRDQITVTDDEVYFEVRRFLELLKTANPTVLELLFSPDDCIIQSSPQFDLIRAHRDKFLTKQCRQSFGGYAVAQIKKATGLDKKMNWEREKVTRKELLDFVYVIDGEKSIPWKKWVETHKFDSKFCGATNVPHARDVYAVFYDVRAASCFSELYSEESRQQNRDFYKAAIEKNGGAMGFGYKGLVKEGGSDNAGISNQLRLSSIPKGETSICNIYYNKDGYSQHCKDFREYEEWLAKRNTQRYVDVKGHGQQIDGKNMLHCRRLLDMATEIARDKTITVRRPNADYLLSIRRGEVDLTTIITQAEKDIELMDELFLNSDLPEAVDPEFLHNLLIEIRNL